MAISDLKSAATEWVQTGPVPLDWLQTPALLLDQARMDRNIEMMAGHSRRLGVPLRPHGKTPKCAAVLKRLMAHGALGVTASTVAEVEGAAAAGVGDIFYAVALEHRKIARLAAVQQDGVRLSCLTSSLAGARLCAAEAARLQTCLEFWIEIDVDGYRSGIPADSDEFEMLARFLETHPATRLRGLMSYGGISYQAPSTTSRAEISEAHRQALLNAQAQLRSKGIEAKELSFGSGPAVQSATQMDGVSELRCGIYIFQDLFQAGIGACGIEDIAVTVLTTVIGSDAARNRLVIDAGALALSKDRSTAGTSFDAGFGLIIDAATGELIDGLYVGTVSQELGLVTTLDGSRLDFQRYPVGTRLRVLPNHADMTAAGFPGYHVLNGGCQVVDYWARYNFW
jgi:D-serine deaminase-like pyridoxal phosphate-dependent protein